MRYKFLLIFLLVLIKVNSQTYDYYVSNAGNNLTGDGSITSPFATINKAQSVVRNQLIVYPMTQDIRVHIAGGTYLLGSTLVFNSDDSGNNGHFVIYQGDAENKPIISSGKTITNWEKLGKKNIYKANIDSLYSRQVYINGTKATRARSEDNMGLIETKNGYFSSCNDSLSWANIKDVEIVSNMLWKSYRIPVDSVCNGRQLLINNDFWKILHDNENFKMAPVKWVENAFELLDQPNEWYIDKLTNPGNNTIYLVSNNFPTNVVIPTLESLIKGDGAENIKFTNLTFNYTTWTKPSEINNNITGSISNNGFSTEQADYYSIAKNGGLIVDVIPGAVSFINAYNIFFTNNEFAYIGSTALSFGKGSGDNIICSNKFEDISATAIRVGNNFYEDIQQITRNEIKNNFINNIGNEYFGSVGIFVPYARNTTITHNTLSKFPYSGISLGWGWNKSMNVGVNNISYNRIDCNEQIIPDSGGIYTLSSQGAPDNKTQIIGNYILNQRFYLGGIYLDNDSSDIHIEGNVIDADSRLNIPAQIYCRENPITSIVFYSGSEYIDIINNYYNEIYRAPPLTEAYCTDPKHLCSNINVSNNTVIIPNDFAIQNIINNSGVQSNFNCNKNNINEKQ